jgi:hypothetical protein
MMNRSMEAKSGGRGESIGLGFGIVGWSMKRVYTGRGIGAILPTSVGQRALDRSLCSDSRWFCLEAGICSLAVSSENILKTFDLKVQSERLIACMDYPERKKAPGFG